MIARPRLVSASATFANPDVPRLESGLTLADRPVDLIDVGSAMVSRGP
ncbi:hypothetical protein CA85_27730 [Allorhodopirellula solitaria]|uniref:Uncharacterized protein n=1 Tax=Allorhodopirellula solitaria TaxID=2527987 RepID=A0A5C5XTR7_9BACT|nr:hypothetical protein CA85_27730 [Allorhodopirellula solitaria]